MTSKFCLTPNLSKTRKLDLVIYLLAYAPWEKHGAATLQHKNNSTVSDQNQGKFLLGQES
jgi:hypothetical protein